MCKNLKGIAETLSEFELALDDIVSSSTITVDGEKERKMTDTDRIELIKSVWVQTSIKLSKYKINLD